jgi:hypothetical protein
MDCSMPSKEDENRENYLKRLQESNHLKGIFIDIIRHDLINPANVIMNTAICLVQRETDAGKKEELELIKNASIMMLEILQDVAKYSDLKNIGILSFDSYNINDILKNVILSFKYQLEEKELVVNFLPAKKYMAYVNPVIAEVFSNLLSNAVKYSFDKSNIVIGIEEKEDIIIYVKNSGIKIKDEDKGRIFNRFERVDREGVEGTGLGLTIAKKIVELHNGKIWVEDNPGGGCIFFISLPGEKQKKT